jgi:hypothetical protein
MANDGENGIKGTILAYDEQTTQLLRCDYINQSDIKFGVQKN